MPRLRKTRPATMGELLVRGDVEEIAAALARCETGARMPTALKESVLHLTPCSDAIVRWLVGRGEDVNAADRCGGRPLHTRAIWRYWQQIPLLLRLGADVDALRKNGATPLHVAVDSLGLEAVDLLLTSGADPSRMTTNRTGQVDGVLLRVAPLRLRDRPSPLTASRGRCPSPERAGVARTQPSPA
ncbi:MAG: ankyrin repeat domain-containing protein [Actinomyces sp.]|uniref:ankyrin repeat domain-containing protein n=1 Tax=Actinomyces sp. TaxID=29317 RepID=UPI0026DD91E2|nr:ankyrin repeat domain-containing protein [Actinomyces sp.]MDO4242618.1 ankyrin repeat domain-containing protein [Actinomyces sp.]